MAGKDWCSTSWLASSARTWAGGWLLSPVIAGETANQDGFSGMSLVVSFSGAMILLVIVNLIRQITADNE